MNNSNDIAQNITQKDEVKALNAAKELIAGKNIEAFEILNEKGAFLFDFIKENVKKRLKKAISADNYKNILAFSKIYSSDFSQTLVECLVKYADEDLTDEIYELLENGDENQKTFAAKYFFYIPDTIAQEILKQNAFAENEILASECAAALGAMKDIESYNNALELLNSQDDFEIIKGIRFLASYGDKSAVKAILDCLETTSMPENVASEILCLLSIKDIIEAYGLLKGLECFDYIISGLSEILPLENLFCYEIYETIEYLMQLNQEKQDGKIAQIIMRAWEKFDTISNNEEYYFDESKEIKQEIKDIFALLNSKGGKFIQEQKTLLIKELQENKKRAQAAIEVIRELQLENALEPLKTLLSETNDENLIIQITETIKALGAINTIDTTELAKKITNTNLKALIQSY